MKIVFVRHGETPSNRDRLALGRADPGLSDLGLRQAEAVARALAAGNDASNIVRVYTSPQLRARQTAEVIAEALSVDGPVTHEDLVEMDVGETDGLTAQELRQRYPEFLRDWFGERAAELPMPGGGESLSAVQARAWSVVEQLKEAHGPHETVVAVSHNFVIRTVVCRALGMELADFRRFQQDLAGITTVEFRGQRTLVAKLNEVCHLDGLVTPQPSFWA